MKRAISLLLAMVMVLGLLPVSAFAAGTEAVTPPAISYETTFVPGMGIGQTFKVTANLDSNPGLAAITLSLLWNDEVVEFTGFEVSGRKLASEVINEYDTAAFNNDSTKDGFGRVTAACSENLDFTGKLFTANFKIIGAGPLGIGINTTGPQSIYQLAHIPEGSTQGEHIGATFGDELEGLMAVPSAAMTTDKGEILSIEYKGELYANYTDVPYYVVTIPEGAKTVYVTDPNQYVTEDYTDHIVKAQAYCFSSDLQPAYVNFPFEYVTEGESQMPKVTLPLYTALAFMSGSGADIVNFVAEEFDGTPTHYYGAEESSFACPYILSFQYPEDAETTVPEHTCAFFDEMEYAEANCTSPATYVKYCAFAEVEDVECTETSEPYTKEDDTDLNPDKHNYVNGKCEWCEAPEAGAAFAVNVDQGIENGTVTADPATAAEGATVTLTVAPDENFRLVADSLTVMQGDTAIAVSAKEGAENQYTFTMPAGDVTVTAAFEEIPAAAAEHDITVNIPGGNGSLITKAGDVAVTAAVEGTEITLEIVPATGYELIEGSLLIMRDGMGNEGMVNLDENGKFIMPAGPITITAQFQKASYTITVAENIANGSVKASAEIAEYGDEITLTAKPEEGYRLVGYTITKENGEVLPYNDNKFTMPAGNVTVTAGFELIPAETYGITVTAPENGTLSAKVGELDVTAETKVEAGTEITVTAAPAEGYQLVAVKVNDVAIEGNTFQMPASDVTITAEFAEIVPVEHTITIADTENGSVEVYVDGEVAETAIAGDKVHLDFHPAKNYTLDTLSVTDAEGMEVAVDKYTTFAMPDSDVTITATFARTQVEYKNPNIMVSESVTGVISAIMNIIEDAVENIDLNALVKIPSAMRIVWESEDPDIASVDPDTGIITALKPGIAKIIAREAAATFRMTRNGTEEEPLATLTVNVGEKSKDMFRAYMDSDKNAVAIKDPVSVNVYIDHDVASSEHSAYELTFKYDPQKLNFVGVYGVATDDNQTTVEHDAQSGTILVRHYGEGVLVDRDAEVMTLEFESAAVGSSYVVMTDACIGTSEDAIAHNIPKAQIAANNTRVNYNTVEVTLDENFTGDGSAIFGEDYTFEGRDPFYTYTPKATIGETEIEVTDNGDGTFTIKGEDITGSIVINCDKPQGKQFEVTKPDGTKGTATYGTDYTLEFNKDAGKNYNVKVTVGGSELNEGVTVTDADGKIIVTIAGNKIKGDIVITATPIVAEDSVKITWAGNGAGFVTNKLTSVAKNAAYSFGLNVPEGFDYDITVTYQVGSGEPVTVNAVDGNYTIQVGTEDLTITVAYTSDLEVHVVTDYVDLNGKTVVMIYAQQALPNNQALYYDGQPMFYTEKYMDHQVETIAEDEAPTGIWVFLAIESDALNADEYAEGVKTKITNEEVRARQTLEHTYDVNETGTEDINDAQLAYDIYNKLYDSFGDNESVELPTMRKFLNADVNCNMKVDTQDAAAVVNQILDSTN